MKQILLFPGAVLALLLLQPAAGAVDYVREIKPVLAARCYACHGALQQKGGLRVDTAQLLRDGGNSGPALLPGRPQESLVLARVSAHKKGRMPPASEGEGLAPAQVALLRAWISAGAHAPADEKPEPDPRDHWAFRAPVRPAVPPARERVRNPIDAFLAAAREKRGITPQPPAERRLLLRRVYLDLVGLPSSRQEQEAFLADSAEDAYEKVVDRLLASPQYGERWGRHWMDIWRYSDWWGLGAEVRNSQKHIWHWRDWIIESLNADKGYDQMLREMLAADELYPNDLDRLRATGFLARQYFLFNRNTWMEETIEHTSKAFLGLTLNCARCHDHKFDPIAQIDYYRFRAFFEPYQVRTEEIPGQLDAEKDGVPRAFDCNLEAPTYRFLRGDERQPIKDRPLAPGLPRLLAFAPLDIHPVALPAEAHSPGLRPFVLADHLRLAETEIEQAQAALADLGAKNGPHSGPYKTTSGKPSKEQAQAAVVLAEKTLARAKQAAQSLRARAAADRARATHPDTPDAQALTKEAAAAERRLGLAGAEEALARAELELLKAKDGKKPEAGKKRDAARTALAAARKALQSPGESYTPLRGAVKTRESNLETDEQRSRPFPRTSTGRRSALARWLTDDRHPLTARVAVNHVWARHFGKPLVATVFDFGRKGAGPTHPELLDWLAVELVEKGWSLKHLHRLMVTSEAYRRSSASADAAASRTIDPENRYYWRMNPIRMDAQALRDSLLSLAGALDPTQGGPALTQAAAESSTRRSIYFFHSHNDHHRFLSMFDDASVLECYRRQESIVPQQALALSNSRFSLEMAGKINDRLHRLLGSTSDRDFVRAAFETLLACSPAAAEQAECEQMLSELRQHLAKQGHGDAQRRARGRLVGALLNHNDFITIR
jgi:hypothetical protein